MPDNTGSVLNTPRAIEGYTFITTGTCTVATPATADTITFTNFFPDFGVTPREVMVWTDKEIDTNASPGTFTAGDGTDADGYIVATSMGTAATTAPVVALGTGALMNTYVTGRNLVITLGTIGTAGSAVTFYARAIYESGNTDR